MTGIVTTESQMVAQPAGIQGSVARSAIELGRSLESQFLSMMLAQMFQGVPTDGPFGGGFGEEMFRSMMTDAMAKEVTKSGGIGLADTVQREMLKMQGLS